MTLTENQSAAMTALIKNCLNVMGGTCVADLVEDPWVYVRAEDLVNAGWTQKQAEGTFGSLVAGGYIYHDVGGNYTNDLYALDGYDVDFSNLLQFHEQVAA